MSDGKRGEVEIHFGTTDEMEHRFAGTTQTWYWNRNAWGRQLRVDVLDDCSIMVTAHTAARYRAIEIVTALDRTSFWPKPTI
jgi:hypothetical protein